MAYRIVFIFLLLITNPAFSSEYLTLKDDRKSGYSAQAWVEKKFSKGGIPPFSFVYGGIHSSKFITSWNFESEKKVNVDGTVLYRFIYSDRRTGLKVVCKASVYTTFNTVEWVLHFQNVGKVKTSILEKVQVINHSFGYRNAGEFILHHANGSNAKPTDFAPMEKKIRTGEAFVMTPSGARGSSDNTAFPFFNIECAGQGGIMAAVGWTGKWYAQVQKVNNNEIALQAGMETMQLELLPGEQIRTPSICLLFWEGTNRMNGHNAFRQFVLAHHSPKINGKIVETPLAAGVSRGGPAPCNEFTCLTESYAVASIERFRQFDIMPEVCWIDAGWYEGGAEWWEGVGNWTIDKKRFPKGLVPVSDATHANGAKLLVWFELERVRKGTKFAEEHAEWLLEYAGTHNKDDIYNNDTYIFDLGNEQARLWLTDFVTDFLQTQGIDYYRQDFNWVNAKDAWDRKDKPGRVGISEIRYIEGLYAFWDSLLVRFPGLLIDNCASGGRRIDLESISRTVLLWRSDYGFGEPNGYQNHTYGLNFYLPLHGTGAFSSKPYDFRSSLSSSVVLFWDIHSANSSIPQMQQSIQEFKQVRPYYYGDYYPLTSSKELTSDSAWLAYQLNRPEKNDGVVIAFRRQKSLQNSVRVQLNGLKANAVYEMTDVDSGLRIKRSGAELSNGFELVLEKPISSLILTYQKD